MANYFHKKAIQMMLRESRRVHEYAEKIKAKEGKGHIRYSAIPKEGVLSLLPPSGENSLLEDLIHIEQGVERQSYEDSNP
ncbi:MAG: hypothetical protein AABX28_03040 [Nanoarchaeota archaeon]